MEPGVAEKYLRVVQVIYGDSKTVLRCAFRVTDGFPSRLQDIIGEYIR